MTNTVGGLAAQIATSFGIDKAAGWDPVGLQLGDPAAAASRVAVCHEVTSEIVSRAVAERVDLVVSYHPLLFRAVSKLVSSAGPAGRAFQLVSRGVALVVVHTAFDVMTGGTADALAAALGLEETSGFGPGWGGDTVKIVTFAPIGIADDVATAMTVAGAGRIGSYSSCSFRTEGIGTFYPEPGASPQIGRGETLNRESEIRIEMVAPAAQADSVVAALVNAHTYEEPAYDVIETRSNAGFIGRAGTLSAPMTVASLSDHVHDRLGGVVRVSGSGPVSTVAVIPGSGGSFLSSVDADVVVTGDVSHHQARAAAEASTAVIDPGHAATERPGVKALYAAVAETIGDAIDMTDVDPDPWKER
ncbi:MAG: Nif3-like dinuclear metal center hexameric protein [Actinomycetota bacterium]|nr:Nif3-like dinuclear metal center hexameric protein [Actinomycetota bacterium]